MHNNVNAEKNFKFGRMDHSPFPTQDTHIHTQNIPQNKGPDKNIVGIASTYNIDVFRYLLKENYS